MRRLRLLPILYIALTVTALWPIFAVPIPCLGDYLNHLARIHVITTLGQSPALQQFYQLHWTATPYLGMDAVMMLLCKIVPLYQAGQIFLAFCVLMPVAAVAALRLAITGRIGLMPAAAFLVSYNYQLSLGFLDYLFSVGLAMVLFAAWIGTTRWPRWPRAAIFAAGLLAVYFSHAFACAAFCIAVAGFEIGRAACTGFRPWTRIALDWSAAASTSVPARCFAATVDRSLDFAGPPVTAYGGAAVKLGAALSPVLFPGATSVTLAILCFACLTLALLARCWRIPPAAGAAVALTALAAAAVPHILIGVWASDFRLPLVVALLLLGSVSLKPALTQAARFAAAACLVALVCAKSVAVHATLQKLQAQVDEIGQLVARMPPGQRLLVVDVDDPAAPDRAAPAIMTQHMPMLAVIERDAFLPYLFVEGNIVVRGPLRAASSPNGGPITLSDLRDGLTGTNEAAMRSVTDKPMRIYWRGWPAIFDYVLIQNFGARTPNLPPALHLVARADIAALYRVEKPGLPGR